MREQGPLYYLLHTPYFIPKRLQDAAIHRHAARLSGTLLDVGCGNQVYRRHVRATRYIGMEIEPIYRPAVVGDARSMPFKDESVDSVLCTEVLEHVPQPDEVFGEIRRVLRPAGLLLLTAPMEWNLHKTPHDYRRFTSFGLLDLAHRHGFEPLALERIGGVFSLVGSRLAEVLSGLTGRGLRPILGERANAAGRLLVAAPLSLTFYGLGRLMDGLDETDAIGWLILARKVSSR